MHLFGGRAREDRAHVYATLRSLGPTSVAGLSAALSWNPRRTDKVLREALNSGDGVAIRYDTRTGSVALLPPTTVPSASSAAPPAARPAAPAPAAPAPPALPKSWGASAKCPTCQVALVSTGTGSSQYCPECGRLSSGGSRASLGNPATSVAPPPAPRAAATQPTPVAAPPPGSLVTTHAGPTNDRRAQEMFAAWVTAQPIPCPKCRTPLRHRGVAQYACPACGAQIAFERSGALKPLSTPAMASPSGPSGPTL